MYRVLGCDQSPRTVKTPENGVPALPNSAARTANFIICKTLFKVVWASILGNYILLFSDHIEHCQAMRLPLYVSLALSPLRQSYVNQREKEKEQEKKREKE